MTFQFDTEKFRENLLRWWKENGRSFPWRNTRNSYHILVSEILLHRTKADQVVPVYNRFIEAFPTVRDLASAKSEDVKRLLRPLGLFWRNELISRMAQEIVTRFHGEIPSAKQDLESLPGVSHYIAAAIRCFGRGDAEPLLDTNTVRIIGRVFGVRVTDASRRNNRFRQIYHALIDSGYPREFNYAMIDLGALICTPKNPKCTVCPVNRHCTFGRGLGLGE
jgi:A/G-specific adenine glycosylase